jgi:hypothetical protein
MSGTVDENSCGGNEVVTVMSLFFYKDMEKRVHGKIPKKPAALASGRL